MNEVFINSIDDLLDLFNFKLDRSLPNPNSYSESYFRRPIMPKLSKFNFYENPSTTASEVTIEYEEYMKDQLRYEGRWIKIWRKIK